MRLARRAIALSVLATLLGASFVSIIAPSEAATASGSGSASSTATGAALPVGTTPASLTAPRVFGGIGPGNLSEPEGVAVGPHGNVYVVDRIGERVQEFSANGSFVRNYSVTAPNPPPWDNSGGTGLTGIAVDGNGTMYVSDATAYGGNGYVWKVLANGSIAGKWPVYGRGFDQLGGVTLDPQGNVYVAILWSYGPSSGFEKFNSTGTEIGYYNFGGYGANPYHKPFGITYHAGSIYVLGQGYVDNSGIHFPPTVAQLRPTDGTVLNTWQIGPAFDGGLGNLAFGPDGSVYYVNQTSTVFQLNLTTGKIASAANLGRYAQGQGIAFGTNGTFYVSDVNLDLVYIVHGGHVTSQFGRSSLHGRIMTAVDASGNLYTADGGTRTIPMRITKFDPNGTVVARWGVNVPNSDYYASSLYVDKAGNIDLFATPGRSAPDTYLFKYNATGANVGTLAINDWTAMGTVDSAGNAYVSTNGTLFIYNATLAPIKNWTAPGGIHGLYDQNNSIYFVVGAYNYETQILRYNLSGGQTWAFHLNKEICPGCLGLDGINTLAMDTYGNFYVTDLEASIWRFDAGGNLTGQLSPGSSMGAASPTATGVYVSSKGEPTNVVVRFYTLTTLSGTIRDAAAKAVANATVTAMSTTGLAWRTVTNASGGYSILLPAGSYVVGAVPPLSSNLTFAWYKNATSPSAGTTLTIPPSVRADIVLPRALESALFQNLGFPGAIAEISQALRGANVTNATSIPVENVHDPFTVTYAMTAPQNYTGATAVVTYPDGTSQSFPMTFLSAHDPPGNVVIIFSGEIVPVWNGNHITQVNMEIILHCGSMQDSLTQWTQVGDSLGAKPGYLPETNAGMNLAMDLATAKLPSPKFFTSTQIGADLAGIAYQSLVASLQPGQPNPMNAADQAFLSWNSQYATPANVATYSAANFFDSSGNPTNTAGAYALMAADLSYLMGQGSLNGFLPAVQSTTNPNVLLPLTEEQIQQNPALLFQSVFSGTGFDTTTASANSYGTPHVGDYWASHPLSTQSKTNVNELIGYIFRLYQGPGGNATPADCPQFITFPIHLVDPSGYVKDAVTGNPVAGARVALYGLNITSGAFELVSNPTTFSPNVNPETTGPDGAYHWDVAPGAYRLNVTAPGYRSTNSSTVGVPPAVTDFNISLTPLPTPKTTATPTGTLARNGWYNGTSVRVNLTATDAAGLAALNYTLDGVNHTVAGAGKPSASTVVTITGSGAHTIGYNAVASSGLAEAPHMLQIELDTSSPALTVALVNGSNGQIPSYFAADNVSGIANVTATLDGAPYTLGTAVGPGSHVFIVTATDYAGLTATDRMPFTIQGTPANGGNSTTTNNGAPTNVTGIFVASAVVLVVAAAVGGALWMRRSR
ncbi:MAG: carboxypeptidase regulatory-like domain-containing protein [Thermoplasmatota archaeon]